MAEGSGLFLPSNLCLSHLYSEMDLDDEPPPLPPRNYSWSDVEDDDDDLFQSEDELEEEPSNRISLADQQAMYSSVSILSLPFHSSLICYLPLPLSLPTAASLPEAYQQLV